MAYFATFLENFAEELCSDSIDAQIEYPNVPIHPALIKPSLLIALEHAEYHPPAAFCGGDAFPVDLHLRMRMMQPPERPLAALSAAFEVFIIPNLIDGGFDVRSISLHAPEFDAKLGRMVMRGDCVIRGFVARTPYLTKEE